MGKDEISPETAYMDRGFSCYEEGQTELSVKYYQKALRVNPNNHEALYMIAHAYLCNDQTEKAIEWFTILINSQRLDPDPAYYIYLSMAYLLEGQKDKGIICCIIGMALASHKSSSIFNDLSDHIIGLLKQRIVDGYGIYRIILSLFLLWGNLTEGLCGISHFYSELPMPIVFDDPDWFLERYLSSGNDNSYFRS